MGAEYQVHLRCPQCERLGIVLVDDGPLFVIKRLPSYFRVVKEAPSSEDTKIGCQCGNVFDFRSGKST